MGAETVFHLNLNIFRSKNMQMPSPLFFILLFGYFTGISGIWAQHKSSGPIIAEFGKVWPVPNTSFTTDTTKEFKVVFDIMDSPESHHERNKRIETAARFLNMHAQAGVAPEKLQLSLVVHNKAAKDILDNEGYTKRYGTNNPNSEMIKALIQADVKIILCGQSSLSRNFPIAEAVDGVQLSLSAMTALIQLQDKGYRLIKF